MEGSLGRSDRRWDLRHKGTLLNDSIKGGDPLSTSQIRKSFPDCGYGMKFYRRDAEVTT